MNSSIFEHCSEDFILKKCERNPNKRLDNKSTPLFYAIELGKYELAKKLLEMGANVNEYDFSWRKRDIIDIAMNINDSRVFDLLDEYKEHFTPDKLRKFLSARVEKLFV
jgi:ankyrin repeat protein